VLLRDALPQEWKQAEARNLWPHLDVQVRIERFGEAFKPWPGPQKNVHCWWELENGYAVGWNENPSRGSSFPVIRMNEKLYRKMRGE
jgi:hypothetical protein